MTAYRPGARASELETEALVDLLQRTRRVRRQVALPSAIVASTAALGGAVAHATGHWSVIGTTSSGSYFVSNATLALAAALCGLPWALPGAALYLALRERARRAWLAVYRARPVSDDWPEREDWLAETARRYS